MQFVRGKLKDKSLKTIKAELYELFYNVLNALPMFKAIQYQGAYV